MIEEEKLIEIYTKHKNEIFKYIMKYIYSRETAEDLLHDCFTNLIEYSKKKHINEKLVRGLLYKSAHNLCINYLKKKRSQSIEDVEDLSYFSQSTNPTGNIEYQELQNKILELLNSIDDKSRNVYVMKMDLNLSYSEIAGRIGKSERTVRRILDKTLKYLFESLEKSGFLGIFIYFFVKILD